MSGVDSYHTVRGGDIVIYTRKHLLFKFIKNISIAIVCVFESITVELIMKKHRNVIITYMYRTPGPNVEIFNDSIESILNNFKSNKLIFLCGDLSTELLKHATHRGTKQFLDLMCTFGM